MKPKTLLPMLLMFVFAHVVNAQQSTDARENTLKGIIRSQVESHYTFLSKPTSGQRLLSVTEGTDSIAFSWSGNRETVHENNPEELAAQYLFAPFTPVMTQVPDFRRYSRQNYDSAVFYRGYGTWISYAVANTYDNKDLLRRHNVYLREGSPIYYIDMIYNDYNKIQNAKLYTDTSSTPSGYYMVGAEMDCTYDLLGKLTKDDIIDIAVGNHIYEYFADASGRDTAIYFISPYPQNNNRTLIAYNTGGLIETYKTYDVNQVLIALDSFGYDGVHPYPNYHITYNHVFGGLLKPWREQYMTLNLNGDITDYLMRTRDPNTNVLDSFYRYRATYNSFNNPDTLYFDDYSGNNWLNQSRTRVYHYQLTTGIADVKRETAQLIAYPNPAGSALTLHVRNNKVAVVKVVDIQGQVIRQHDMHGETLQLNMEDIPSGVYNIIFDNSFSTGSIKVVRQ